MARLIDADALIESMGLGNAVKWGNKDGYQQEHSYSTMMLYEIKDSIDCQPTIDAAPLKHGRWMIYKYDEKQYMNVIIPWDGKGLPHDLFCSECRTPALLNGHEEDVDSNYCPNCGAKMDLEDEQ